MKKKGKEVADAARHRFRKGLFRAPRCQVNPRSHRFEAPFLFLLALVNLLRQNRTTLRGQKSREQEKNPGQNSDCSARESEGEKKKKKKKKALRSGCFV